MKSSSEQLKARAFVCIPDVLLLLLCTVFTGEDSLNCKYLAIKRTKRSLAKNGVSDIAVYRAKSKTPPSYKKLGA